MKWFYDCATIEQLKSKYRKLAKMYHPDLGGDTATMQEINAEYAERLESLKAQEKAQGNTSHADENAAEFIHIVTMLLKIKGITLEICGAWIWIDGNTKAVKEQLKAAGCRWASKKGKWYWRPEWAKTTSRRSHSMEYIREKYGSKVYKTQDDDAA